MIIIIFKFLFKGLGATSTHENVPVVEKSEIVIISVKPNIIPIALAEIQTAKIKADKLFLSIAMGVPIKHIEQVSISTLCTLRNFNYRVKYSLQFYKNQNLKLSVFIRFIC